MSQVFVNIGLSLDGYMAPEGMTMGKRTFDQDEVAWPEEAPFHTPVYVLTHEKRETWVRPRWDDLLLQLQLKDDQRPCFAQPLILQPGKALTAPWNHLKDH